MALAACGHESAPCNLTVVGWGGSSQDAHRNAYWRPFTQQTGITLREDVWNGGIGVLRTKVRGGDAEWDVVQVEVEELMLGCEEGLFEKIDWQALGGRDAYIAPAVHDCGVGAMVWSEILAYDGDRLKEGPRNWADFWDLRKFPGRRGMRKTPKYTLEVALLADGVEPSAVYGVLATPAGVDRAFRKLDELKPSIVWWSTVAQVPDLLASGEVALSIVLLIGAGLLMRSFFILTHADLGFDPQNVLYFRLNLPSAYRTDVDVTRQKKNALTRQLLDRLRALPGVTSVSESMLEPPIQYDWSDTIIPGKPHTERWETHFEVCSEGYFQILGLPLLHGRLLSEDDMNAQRHVMVVNETFSRQYFPGEDPIGHQVKLQVLDRPFLDAPHDTYFEIVGITGDYKTRDDQSRSWRAFPQVYIPYSVQGFSWRTYMARTVANPKILLKNIEQEVRANDSSAEIESSGTLAGSLQEFYQRPQFELFTLGAFAVVGLACHYDSSGAAKASASRELRETACSRMGRLSTRAVKSLREILSTVVSSTARTVAVRSDPWSSATSPKYFPGPSVATTCSCVPARRTTSTFPALTI